MAAQKSPTLSLFIPLIKVDEEQHMVYGRATQEVPDSAGEIMDYASSAPRFRNWSESTYKRSGGKSKGNIRAMHQPVAAGKLIDMQFNDSERAVDIGVKVVDDNEWQKVVEGIYSGFSVGGKYARRWPDPKNPRNIRYTAEPQEISLVDAPAVPTATFALVKADGTTETRKFKNVLPIIAVNDEEPFGTEGFPLDTPDDVRDRVAGDAGSEAETQPSTELAEEVAPSGNAIIEVPTVAGIPSPTVGAQAAQAGVEPASIKGESDMSKAEQLLNQLRDVLGNVDATITKLADLSKIEADEKEKILAELKQRGSSVGIARRDGEPLTQPKGYPEDWRKYGDPANWSWPVDEQGRAQSAVSYYNGGSGKEKYTTREWHTLGRRIARLASAVFGAEYRYSPTENKVERKDKSMSKLEELIKRLQEVQAENLNKADVMGLLSQVKAALSEAADMVGKDPGQAQNLLMAVLGNLDGIDTGSIASTGGSPSAPVDSGGSTIKAVTPTTPSTMTTPSVPSTTKAMGTCPNCGGPLGSDGVCPKCGTATTGSTKTAGTTIVVPPSSSSSEETPNAYEAMKAQVNTLSETIKALTERIDKIAPAPAAAVPAAEKVEQPAAPAAPVAKVDPVGDLNAIINQTQADEPNEIMKAYLSGDLPRADELAKAAHTSLNAEIMKATLKEFDKVPFFDSGHRIYNGEAEAAPAAQ